MELNRIEMDSVEAVIPEAHTELKKLTELELVMVGGGTGDVSFG